MRRRHLATLTLLLLGSLALATAAMGGGWAQVTATDIPADPPAGEETVVGLMVMQHGVTAVSWPTLTVVATDGATGTVVRAAARPAGPAGAYVAAITFPTAGEWTLAFESTDLMMEGTAVLTVAAAAAAPSTTSGADPTPILLVAAALALLLLTAAIGVRRGRRDVVGEAPASVHG